MEAIWDQSDCELSLEIVDSLLAEQAPHAHFTDLRFLDEGWSSWAYTAVDAQGAGWIFRFPKRASVALTLEREIGLLPLLAPRLPLPIPIFELIGEPGPAYPHPFVGYRKLPGTPAVECFDAPFDIEAVGTAAGAFLAALHSAPPSFAQHAARIPRDVVPGETSAGQAAELAHARLAQFGNGLSENAISAVRRMLERPVEPMGDLALVHNDLFPEHYLLAGGTPVAVIDWGDVRFGDPAQDLAGLCYWRGEPLLTAGLSRYSEERALTPAAVQHLAARARFIAVLRAADDLEYGTRANRLDYLHMAHHFLELIATTNR